MATRFPSPFNITVPSRLPVSPAHAFHISASSPLPPSVSSPVVLPLSSSPSFLSTLPDLQPPTCPADSRMGSSMTDTSQHDALGQTNREFWDKQAETIFEQEWVRNLSSQLRDCLLAHADAMGLSKTRTRPAALLDYACGNGLVSQTLLEYFDRIRGVDVSDTMVTAYNQLAQGAGVPHERMHAVQGNLLDPPTTDATDALDRPDLVDFDAAIMSMALHHVGDPEGMLAQLVRRLRSGGVVVVLEWMTSDADEADRHTAAVGHHTTSRHSFSHEEMRAMFVQAGCQPESVLFHAYKESSHIPEHVTKTQGGVDRTFFMALARKP